MRLRLTRASDDRAAELLAAIGEDASATGAPVVWDDASDPARAEPGDVSLFIPGVDGLAGPPPGLDRHRSVALCTEFPGSDAFDAATSIAASAAAVLSVSEASVVEQRRRGVPARRFGLGLSTRWRVSPCRPATARERDVLFIGAHTPRRERLLSSNAPSLAAMRAEIWLGSPWPGSPPPSWSRPRRELLASSSMVLDLHPRGRPHGLDRALALEALGAGAVPVFEHSVELGELEPGTHLELADGAQLGLVAGRLLQDPDRLDRMASEASAFARSELSPRPAIEALIASAEDVARRARRRGRWRLARRRPSVAKTDERNVAPEALRADRAVSAATAATRKRSVLTAIERRGEVRARALKRDGLGGELRCMFESEAWDSPARRVAVCIPVHDDGELAVQALDSAVASVGVGVELVVADDASGDDSLLDVQRWLGEHRHVPARLFASAVNRGVGAVRNDLMAQATAPLAFMLDADNVLFPEGLARLVEALEAAPEAAFAYGLLERTRVGRSAGLISAGPWEPERLRAGNYIDAMALLRRDRILAIGGFATDRRLYGWEDFDLWCRVAEEHGEAVFVPQLIGRYRARHGSMLSVAEIDSQDAVALLRERAPRLRPTIPSGR